MTKTARKRYLAYTVLALAIAPAFATQATRTWTFDLRTPGTYEVHVQHKYETADTPQDFVASYAFITKEKTDKRDISLSLPTGEGYRVAVLRVEVPSSQRATFTATGIPKPLLRKTRVYLVEADSVSPEKMFDPKNSIELPAAKRVREFLIQPPNDIELAKVKLAVDKFIDPAVDVEANLATIGTMIDRIKAMPGFGISKAENLKLLTRYVYEPGEWNNFQPFQYDLDDPLGADSRHKLLSYYLKTKKGNCVTMPILFVILGQRLGLDVTLTTAPMHMLVKAKDDTTGAWYNLETTSGANPARDVWIRKNMPMTDEAIANGVYLQPLTKKEAVAMIASLLAEHYSDEKDPEKIITIADIALEYYPKFASMMVMKSNAYYELSARHYMTKYRSPDQIPEDRLPHYHYLHHNNNLWSSKAVDLGWRAPTKEEEEQYWQSIKNAKNEIEQRRIK